MKKVVRVPSGLESGSPVPVRARDEVTGALVDPGQPLVWRRTVPLVPDFELRQGENVFGEMEPSNSSALHAAGECLGQSLGLRFDLGPFGGVRVATIRASEDEGPAFRGLSWGWGKIRTPGGETLRWRHAFVGLYSHLLLDAQGVRLLHMRPTFLRFGRTETKVTLSDDGWRRPDLAELLLLTWFLRAHTESFGRRVFGKPKKRPRGDFP